jgi:hypothetical protein
MISIPGFPSIDEIDDPSRDDDLPGHVRVAIIDSSAELSEVVTAERIDTSICAENYRMSKSACRSRSRETIDGEKWYLSRCGNDLSSVVIVTELSSDV